MVVVIVASLMLAYSVSVLHKNPQTKTVYKKAYKIQAASGFLINIAFIIGAFS